VGIPCDIMDEIAALGVQSKSALILAITRSFVAGPQCNAVAMAMIPLRGIVQPVAVWIDDAELRQYRKIAKRVAPNGSVSKLFQAALNLHFPKKPPSRTTKTH